jgi:hypothetical protein
VELLLGRTAPCRVPRSAGFPASICFPPTVQVRTPSMPWMVSSYCLWVSAGEFREFKNRRTVRPRWPCPDGLAFGLA